MVKYYTQEQSDMQAKELGFRLNAVNKEIESNKISVNNKNILESLSRLQYPATLESMLEALNEALLLNKAP